MKDSMKERHNEKKNEWLAIPLLKDPVQFR